MRKGRHRRNRQARQFKQQSQPQGQRLDPCIECSRVGTHADWCLAEADLEEMDYSDLSDDQNPPQ